MSGASRDQVRHARDTAMRDLAERFFDAIATGDIDALRSIYAPDAVVWHNTDRVEQPLEQNLRVLRWVHTHVRDFRYEQQRCQSTETGFIEQHVTRGRAPDGSELAIAACVVATVVDMRIVRIEEYLDSAQISSLPAGPPPVPTSGARP